MTISSFTMYQQITSVRLVSVDNLSGLYYNGQLNNGVGSYLIANNDGLLVIDNVEVEIGDRLLLISQTNSNENGIYIVEDTGDEATPFFLKRVPDLQNVEQIKSGQYFSVGAGDSFAGAMYIIVEPLPDIVGIDPILFVETSAGGFGPYLRVDQNLSDVANKLTSYQNLGFGSGQYITLEEEDFIDDQFFLPNPCPNLVDVHLTVPGTYALILPPMTGETAFNLAQGLAIANTGTQNFGLFSFEGPFQPSVSPGQVYKYFLIDNEDGGFQWERLGVVLSVDGKTGIVQTVVQSWDGSTTPVDVTAGSGIDITNGVISLTGSGPSAAWSTEWTNDNNFSESFTDTTTFKGIRIDDLNAFSSNFTVALDGSSYIYFQYTGLETAEFRIGLTNRIRTVNNVNPNTYNYSLGIDSGSGIVPIYSGNALMPFVTQGNSDVDSVNVSYNISVLLDPGDKLYPIIQNRGDGNPTNNEYVVRNLLVDIQKIGDVGGVDSGVVSLNGLDGVLNLTSDGSIDIDPSGTSITLSAGTFTEVSGTSQSMVANGRYFCTNVANTTLSLPTSNCPAGSPIEVAGGNHQIIISQESGQKIYHGNGSTTTGISGNLTSDPLNPYSCVKLLCIQDNLTFQVIYSQGNFTLN